MKDNAVSDGEVVKESLSTGNLITLPSRKSDGFCTPNFINGSGSSDVKVIRDGASTQESEHDYSGEGIVISMSDTGRSLDMNGLTEKNAEITDSIVNGSRRSDTKVIRDGGFPRKMNMIPLLTMAQSVAMSRLSVMEVLPGKVNMILLRREERFL